MALYPIDPNAMRGSGTFTKGRAGEALGRCKLVYKNADGSWYLADADLVALMPTIGLTMDRVNAGQRVRILKEGYIGSVAWAWTVGTEMYASSVPGELVQVAAGIVQIVGMATQTDMIYFDPEGTGAGGVVCALLEGHTAYVGFDVCKGTNYTNYFTVDGTADDVQINLAIVYVNGLGGGTVFCERGTYDITASIIPLDDVWIFGAGHDTIFRAANGLNDHVIQEMNAAYRTNMQFHDFKIEGNSANQNAGAGIRLYRSHRTKIENLWIYDTYDDGIDASYCYNIHVLNNRIELTGATGMEIYGDIEHEAEILGNQVISPTLNGIQLYSSVQIDTRSIIDGNTVRGINNEDTNQRGITVRKVNHLVVSNNVADTFRMGIYVNSCRDSLIDGNVCVDNQWDGVTDGNGIRIETACERLIVSNNICNDNTPTAVGILVGNGGGTDVVIDGNECCGNGGAGIRVITDHITITNNICKNNNQSGLGATNDSGINLADDAQYCIVMNNQCYDDQGVGATQAYGIKETGAADFNHIYHNRMSGNTTGVVIIIGADTQVPELFAPISDPNTTVGDHPSVDMPEDTDTNVYAQLLLPLEFQELVECSVIVVSAATGNMVWTVDTDFGKLCVSEDYNTHTDSGGATTALTINDLECLDVSAALTLIAGGDLVGVNFMRDGDDGSDNIEDSVFYMGIRLRYV